MKNAIPLTHPSRSFVRRSPTLHRSLTLLAASSLSLASLGCSGSVSTTPSDAFPAGTYTRCADGSHSSGPFVGTAGFEASGVELTVQDHGSTVTATYLDQNGKTSTFDFDETTSTSATLTSAEGTVPGLEGEYTHGPGDSWLYPALMEATAGALMYDEGTAFVALNGTILPGGLGSCGGGPAPGSIWLVCDDREGGSPSPEPTVTPAPPSAAPFPAGAYACSSLVGMYDAVGATTDNALSDGWGTLTLTQDGADVTAVYSGDSAVTGTLFLTATTATTAIAEANQTMTAPCTVPISTVTGGGPSPTPMTLPLTAGSLALVGSTLFVSFTGTMDAGSACPGALLAAGLICSKQ
jgi:hypothetical protein